MPVLTWHSRPEAGLTDLFKKQLEIIGAIFGKWKDPSAIGLFDLCCGRGFSKTTLCIIIAQCALNRGPRERVLFLEPDVRSLYQNFLDEWMRIVPAELYFLNEGKRIIKWKPTKAILEYGPRVVTGSKRMAADKYRGRNLTAVIDDETAIGFNREVIQNIMACLRIKGVDNKFFLTASTPQIGRYTEYIRIPGHKLFRGRTRDNPYLPPGFESEIRASMSTEQARRELDAEFIALEGRIWKTAKYVENPDDPDYAQSAWPNGNRDDEWTRFRPGEPWWLACDFGSATGSYVVLQRREAYYRGRQLFSGSVWVAVADYCPNIDANASAAFQRLQTEFQSNPIAVCGGADFHTRGAGDGRAVSYFVSNIFGNGPGIFIANEDNASKRIQYDLMSYLICSSRGERRFTIARDFVSLDNESKRGVREMILEDAWPAEDLIRVNDFLPKNREIRVQHVRDALLMGSEKFMCPPRWGLTKNPAAA